MIDEFIARYTKEFDFYEQAARLVARELEMTLQAAGIRSIVTHRAKSIARLRDKCRKRQRDKGEYASVTHIFDDIVDLAGVRVALYFPAERDEVDKEIGRLFDVHLKKAFPEPESPRQNKRFTGYNATHYRVKLKEQNLGDADKRYAVAKVEIQVASVLMHAWAEVEHDLVYKPFAGELSEDEHAILDQLNGLVIAGEIALERLQKAGEARVAHLGRRFSNHFDLAAHLLSRVATAGDEPISDAGLGRIDLLFELISELRVNTPEALSRYLEGLHGNLELRPLAEQIIDGLLAEDQSRYDLYSEIRERMSLLGAHSLDPAGGNNAHQMGLFIAQWGRIEQLIRGFARRLGLSPPYPLLGNIRKFNLLPREMVVELDQYRQIRNQIVHGIDIPAFLPVLEQSTKRLEVLADELQRSISRQDGDQAPRDNEPDD